MRNSCAILLGVIVLASASARVDSATPFTIDVVLPITGPVSFIGNQEATALGIFERYANKNGGVRGQPIHFEIHDDQSSPQVSVQLTNAVIAKKAAVVLGSSVVAGCSAMAVLTKDGPVQYCFSPGIDPPKDSYVFAAGKSLTQLVSGLVRYMRLRGVTKYGVISSIDASGQANDIATQRAFDEPANRGSRVVAWEHFNPTDVSASAQIARIKAAHPDGLFVWVAGTAFATILRNLFDAGIDVPTVTTAVNSSPAQLQQSATFMPTDLLTGGFPGQLTDAELGRSPIRRPVDDFVGAFREAGVQPEFNAASTWDVASIVTEGFRALGVGATAQQLRAYIEGRRRFAGVNGIYDFSSGDQHGLTNAVLFVVRWNPKTAKFDAASDLGGNPLRR